MATGNQYLDKIRRLTIGLVVSGGINVVVLAFLFYWVMTERVPIPYCESKPANQEEQQAPLADFRTCGEVVRGMKDLSFEQLVARLQQKQLVENGLTQRDLALTALVAFHHFDLKRALTEQPQEQRGFSCGKSTSGKPVHVIVYPGLTDKQFGEIVHFAQTERWPITSRGLFALLQKNEEQDKTLNDAFSLTEEYLAVETLFAHASSQISKTDLLSIIREGNWRILKDFVQKQRISHDQSDARRQLFLIEYIRQGSPTAAYALLKMDPDFAAKKLDDKDALAVLNLLKNKSPEAEKFALEMLTSPRTTIVWQHSAARLYEYAGEAVPSSWSYQNVLKRFAPKRLVTRNLNTPPKPTLSVPVPAPAAPVVAAAKPKKPPPMPSTSKDRYHAVKEGDSLWKIAKKYRVTVESLKSRNQLKSDVLKTGTILKIPAAV